MEKPWTDVPCKETRPVVEGYSFDLLTRICGVAYFFLLNPLFIWIWIDNPHIHLWHPDVGTVIMSGILLAMVLLGVCGLMVYRARTRIYRDAIEWGLLRTRRLALDDVWYVDHIDCYHYWVAPGLCVLCLMTNDKRKIGIPGGDDYLYDAFLRLESRFPK